MIADVSVLSVHSGSLVAPANEPTKIHRYKSIYALVTLFALAVFSSPSRVRAQDEEAARAEFNEGVAAVRVDDWETARDHFERAYELAPRPSVLVNLAGAQRQTGMLVEALASYRLWLENPPNARQRRRVQQEVADLEPRIPSLTVSAVGTLPTDEFLVDGDPVQPNVATAFNPGWREVEVQRDGRTLASLRVNLDEGDEEEVQLTIRNVPSPTDTARTVDPEDPEAPPILNTRTEEEEEEESGSKTWLWVTIGVVAAAAIGGGIMAGVLLSGDEDPFVGNTIPGTVTVR